MKCFGDKARTFHCKVVLLDEQELIQEVQETTSGHQLLDVVYMHLNLVETSYFGLRYIDPSNQTHWLDPNKRLVKQLKGLSPFTLYFSVKFYAADPTKLLEEITRYQFFLQIKQDVLQGRLPVAGDLAAELGSLAVQSELGDYDPRRHSPGYVSEFRFVANQSVALEAKIADRHKKILGYVPSKAEMCYLEKVKWLDMFGVDLHPVLGEDSTEYFLGLTPSGIIVLRNKAKVGNYFWPRITKVYFKGRFFMLRVKDKNNVENTYGFETPSKSACKHLWQCCVEHHAFFRLTQMQHQAAGGGAGGGGGGGETHGAAQLISIGAKLSGRGTKECVGRSESSSSKPTPLLVLSPSSASSSASANRPQTEFARTPSRRYQRRIVERGQDTPRAEDPPDRMEPETRTLVSLPGTVTPVSHVYRSTSMTLSPPGPASPRSTRSAPHPPTGLQRGASSPHKADPPNHDVPLVEEEGKARRRRTSSVESQSSVDSRRSCNRSCSRHRRSRCRSSDGESEASSKCSSSSMHGSGGGEGGVGKRHHHRNRRHHRRHRHQSDDSSEHHKHRHRRHRHRSSEKNEPQMVASGAQWAQVQSGRTPSKAKSNTATVRDLTSGYLPSGHEDTETDVLNQQQQQQHSSRRKHRKHRSPSWEWKGGSSSSKGSSKYPAEIRRHIDFSLQSRPDGITEAELRQIPYTKVETDKLTAKGKRHKSPRRSKSNSSERKSSNESTNNAAAPDATSSDKRRRNGADGDHTTHGTARPCPRSSPDSRAKPLPPPLPPLLSSPAGDGEGQAPPCEGAATSPPSSHPVRSSSPLTNSHELGTLQRLRTEGPSTQQEAHPLIAPLNFGPKPTPPPNHGRTFLPNGNHHNHTSSSYNPSNQDNHHPTTTTTSPFRTFNHVTTSYTNSPSPSPHRNSTSCPSEDASPLLHPDSAPPLGGGGGGEGGGGYLNGGEGFRSPLETGSSSHFTALLKPQPSPQSSVTSGISVGSSSASTTVAETSEGEFQRRDEGGFSSYSHLRNYNDRMLYAIDNSTVRNNDHDNDYDYEDDNRRFAYERQLPSSAPSALPHATTNGFVHGINSNNNNNNMNNNFHSFVKPLDALQTSNSSSKSAFRGPAVATPKQISEGRGTTSQPKSQQNTKFYSAFSSDQAFSPEAALDKGYHTIEKSSNASSSVNLRNNFNSSQSHKLAKERPNSFSYNPKPKVTGTLSNNEYNPNKTSADKYGIPNDQNPRLFKPILKSFASEDNLNAEAKMKAARSQSTDGLDVAFNYNNNNNNNNYNCYNNNKNRVRWNIQEKTRNMINLKDGNNYYKSRDHNSVNKCKPNNNIQNVKNDVVYAGKGEIIEIKNNQIITIKSAPPPPPPPSSLPHLPLTSSVTSKKDNNGKAANLAHKQDYVHSKPLFRDEISTEL